MTIIVDLYADREAVVTLRRSWLGRLLRLRERDPRIAVGDAFGEWYWHATGCLITDPAIRAELDRHQRAYEALDDVRAWLQRN